MPKEEGQLVAAKRAYKNASAEGNRAEEARWANMIGNILKNRGEYVEALKWFRIDYDISLKHLPEKQVMPTCQSLGEVYLRLQHFKDALTYQKKHLDLAKCSHDIVEQQRASTQLGRTYHEMFLSSSDGNCSVRKAKDYFRMSMKLAETIKNDPPSNTSFVKEFIDAYNNIGMFEMDLDNPEEAEKILKKGLNICDEEEIIGNDDGRSRLHHNLGNVYMELRMWDNAREHIEKDIIICKNIEHHQGEAKGYINLGELHYRVQRYQEATLCYKKALDLAMSMEDEDVLVGQINQNIETVNEAIKVMRELKDEEQILKKMSRKTAVVRGKPNERKCLLQHNAILDSLIEKSSMISAWLKHREFSKRKKRIASELCDKEKLSDSYLVIGESYQKLRKFDKALKWCNKAWEIYKSIGNLEGQALAKINIGDVLDCHGDWRGALDSFEEGHSIAVEAKLHSVQISALENMHYSHMIRFNNTEEARKLQILINDLKRAHDDENNSENVASDFCSETDSEGVEFLSERSHASSTSRTLCVSPASEPCMNPHLESENDTPLISLVRSERPVRKRKTAVGGRKRVRLVLSDDEGGKNAKDRSSEFSILNKCDIREITSLAASKAVVSSSSAGVMEESTCSYRSNSSSLLAAAHGGKQPENLAGAPKVQLRESLTIKMDDDVNLCMNDDVLTIESFKEKVACLYYLHLPLKRRMKGLLPIIKHVKMNGGAVESMEDLEMLNKCGMNGSGCLEIDVDGWVQKLLMKAYLDCCEELSEPPNLRLLGKLYNTEVSEDEVILSGCELQDVSVMPLMNALRMQRTVALLDLSHNLLGNGTMKKLQEVLTVSEHKYGGFTLDLHCNKFGSTALFQICECGVLYERLEVLNISGNRFTDACGSYLSTILQNCKALYCLKMERCSVTGRTIQKVADSLSSDSVLSQLWIGHNAVGGAALLNLLLKLKSLGRFSELSLSGLKLSGTALDALSCLVDTASISTLILAATNIRDGSAIQLADSLVTRAEDPPNLDLSQCGLSATFITKLTTQLTSANELILGQNSFSSQGGEALGVLLRTAGCSVRVLVVNKCGLGYSGVLAVIRALSENDSVEEVDVSENIPARQDDGGEEHAEFVMEASRAVSATTLLLNLIDMSGNGLSPADVDLLYAAWSAGSRLTLARKNTRGSTVRLFTSTHHHRLPCCAPIR